MKVISRRKPIESAHALPDGIHPVLARVYASRDLESSQALENKLKLLLPFDSLKGIEAAVTLLQQALQAQWRILVVADFDTDGATSCAVAVRALRMLGFQHVNYVVPRRFDTGYGLTPELISADGIPPTDLIITVDNGISSISGTSFAKGKGIRVLITDHHIQGDTLPDADAIVNPNQIGDEFPSKNLAGVGVIFYVMLAFRSHLRHQGWFKKQNITAPNLGQLLDLVALGTVADMVSLDHNNRILVAQGLARMRSGTGSAGIYALLEVSGRRFEQVVASDMGYAVAPRLNAAGRLNDMSLGIECLLCDQADEANEIAGRLNTMNLERRKIEAEMRIDALRDLDDLQLNDESNELPFGIALYNKKWHQGIVGVIASRIKELHHRPVIVFAPGQPGEIKGSARSISGLQVRDVIAHIDAAHPGLIKKFGGHAMAAGLTMDADGFELFRDEFDYQVRRQLKGEDLKSIIWSDGELQEYDMDMQLAETLRSASPWGQGFPEPVFDGVFQLVSRRVVGEKHLKLLLKVPGANEKLLDAIAFNTDDSVLPVGATEARLAYRLDINRFRGQTSIQMVALHIEAIVN
ncbi:MAG: single-stranded-DNA-specific exonuclease RecJ [Gammaproteobacteria bacterium]|nr:single-stranded-DNA-specific exonuclease RecJ [Gammaproteobacteria bacterium]